MNISTSVVSKSTSGGRVLASLKREDNFIWLLTTIIVNMSCDEALFEFNQQLSLILSCNVTEPELPAFMWSRNHPEGKASALVIKKDKTFELRLYLVSIMIFFCILILNPCGSGSETLLYTVRYALKKIVIKKIKM